MKKRFLNLFMALALVVCVLPMAASAAGCIHDWENGVCKNITCGEECKHESKRWEITKNPTCETTGLTGGYVCKICGMATSGHEEIPVLGHEFKGKETVTTAATCTSTGTKTVKCIRCDATEEKTIDKLPHTPKVNPGVEPTCTTKGWTEGSICDVCDAPLVYRQEIAALNHNYSEDLGYREGDEPTCTEAGYRVLGCSRCDATTAQNASEIGHEFEMTVTEPTCTEAGQKKYTCTRVGCDAWYAEPIAALNHDYSEDLGYREGDEPTCTEAGYRVLGCSRCDATTAQNASEIGHEFEMTVTEPTCTEAGQKKYTCTRVGCDAWYAEPIAALNHDYSEDLGYRKGDEPNCMNAGYRVLGCSRCDATTAQTVYALGHDWDITVLKEAACTVKGMEFHACKREGCAVWKYVEIAELGHNKVVVDAVAPTCTATGLTAGEKCSACGEVFTAQTVAEKIPHAWEDVEAQAATCKADGYNAHKACSKCGETDGKTIIAASAAYHEFENFKCKHCGTYDPSHQHEGTGVITTESTCTAEGVKTFECDDCDHTWTEAVAKKPHTYNAKARCTECGALDSAHQHNYVQTAYRQPTCTVEGKVTKKCSVCDDLNETIIDSTGHSYVDGKCTGCGIAAACAHANTTTTVVSDATCNSAGEKVTTCNNCGKTVGTEVIPATGNHNFVNNRCTGCGKNNPNRLTIDFQDVFIVG